MRPTLRPGLRLLRRDPHTLQVGLDWPGLAVVAATPQLRAVVAAIDGFRDAATVVTVASRSGLDPADCEDALSELVRCGAVVDADVVRQTEVPEATWAAWSLLAGPHRSARDVDTERARHRVCVVGDGALADQLRVVLPGSRVAVVDDASAADIVIASTDAEPDRRLSDRLMHMSIPHLWVGLRDLVGVVGPFVAPGVTACLRCTDLARSEVDSAWLTLLDAAAVRPAVPAPADPVLTTLVAAYAVRELALWASGLQPQTYTAVVEVPYGSGSIESVATTRHPRCGCGWLDWHDTMGA